MDGYSERQIRQFLKRIWNGEIDEENLPQDLYFAIGKYLEGALFKGFGGGFGDFEGKDLELLTELHENIWMFSAAKTYQQVVDIRNLMFDKDGSKVDIEVFNKLGRESYDNWNDNYGRTEYVTTEGMADQAITWQQIEEDADILPMLEFDTNGSPCAECAPFHGFCAPVKDPIWSWLAPLLHFHCECILRQYDESKKASPPARYNKMVSLKDSNVPKLFQMNPGQDHVIFKDQGEGKHPYFDVVPKDKELAANNFNLPIPKSK